MREPLDGTGNRKRVGPEIFTRLQRIYGAIQETMKAHGAPLTLKIDRRFDIVTVSLVFPRSLSENQIQNVVVSAIHNTAGLEDSLRRWARKNGKDQTWVDHEICTCGELKVVLDLSNWVKNGPSVCGGRSGVGPRLADVRLALSFEDDPAVGRAATFFFRDLGETRISTSNGPNVIIKGRIIDSAGNEVGELTDYLNKAVSAWDRLCRGYGLAKSWRSA
jgi:hypothetical protein